MYCFVNNSLSSLEMIILLSLQPLHVEEKEVQVAS